MDDHVDVHDMDIIVTQLCCADTVRTPSNYVDCFDCSAVSTTQLALVYGCTVWLPITRPELRHRIAP